MTKPRVTTANRLSNVIEVVELGRRSGLLMVERGAQPSLEEGEVYFSQGRAIYAMVEGLAGREALSVLGGWGQCRFAFEPDAPAPAPNVTAPQPAQQPPMRPATHGTSGPASFTWSAPGSRPASDPSLSPGSTPSNGTGSGLSWPAEWPLTPPASTPSSTGQLKWPGQPGAQPGTLSSMPSRGSTPSQSTGPFTGAGAGAANVSPAALERRPRRAPDVRDLISVVSAYNLSRSHRTLLLLADGEHTVLDLSRLSSKPADEVVTLLADLERLGLVYF